MSFPFNVKKSQKIPKIFFSQRVFNMSMYNATEMLLQIRRKGTAIVLY